MMYTSKLALALKVDGKVLREVGDTVYLPFGAEYSLLLKNMHTRRASCSISIDGKDVMGGQRLIVRANDSVDLERFVTNNERGNRFKFIERTSDVEEYSGVGIEDGLVRVEFQFERELPVIKHQVYTDSPYWYDGQSPHMFNGEPRRTKGITRGLRSRGSTGDASLLSQQTITTMSVNQVSLPANEAGVTAPGSISDQKFNTVAPLSLDHEKHVMVLRMLGETEDNRPVVEPVTVKTRPKCTRCGQVGRYSDKFCTNCGTSLQIVA